MPKVFLFKNKLVNGKLEYTASLTVNYTEALSKQIDVEKLIKLLPLLSKPTKSSEHYKNRVVIRNLTFYPTMLTINDTGGMLFVAKQHQETSTGASIDTLIDTAAQSIREQIPKEYLDDAVAIGSEWNHMSHAEMIPHTFIRIPEPNSPYGWIHIAQLYKHWDLPTMTNTDYLKIKQLMTSPDEDTKKLGIGLTHRWNPVYSFHYLIMLAQYSKELFKDGPFAQYLKQISSSVSNTGLSGELHMDAIDSFIQLNNYVLHGSNNSYHSREDGVLDFIMNEFHSPIKSSKFEFKPTLKKK